MLAYLESGNIFYVLAALCMIGVITKLAVNHVYRGLISQSDNLAAAKDRQLLQLKTKYESIYRINSGIKNSRVLIEKKLGQYRLLRIGLKHWEACDLHMGMLAAAICIPAAFEVYWLDGEMKIIMMYLAAAATASLSMMLLHGIVNSEANRETLIGSLCHYFDNVLIVRGAKNLETESEREEPVRSRGVMQDDIFMKKPAMSELDERMADTGAENSSPVGKKGSQHAEMEALKESLSQIAAARSESPDRRSRRLTAKEEQLIDEILRQYLS